MSKYKLTKEQVNSLISTIYFELQTVFHEVPTYLKDKDSIKVSKQILKNIEILLKKNGTSLGKDSTIHSISE